MLPLTATQQPPSVPGAIEGLPRLRERPRYYSGGLASASALLPILAIGALMFLAGALSAAIQDWLPGGSGRSSVGSTGRWILPIALAVLASSAGIWAIRKGHIRSPWIAVAANLLWATALVAGFDFFGGTSNWFGQLGPAPMPGDGFLQTAQAILLLFFVVILTVVGFQMNGADSFRPYYERHGCWSEQTIAFFKPNSSRKVLQALEFGNARQLLDLRGDGPSGGHSWQNFTALVLYTCPGHPEEPAWIYLKDVAMGGGPLFSSRFQTCYGHSHLKCVRLDQEEVEILRRLDPRLGDAVAAGRSEGTLGMAAGRGSGTPLGLPAGAPEAVESRGGSWIRTLDAGEQRKLRAWFSLGNFASGISVPLIFGFGAIGAQIFDKGPDAFGPQKLSSNEIAFISAFFAMLVISVLLGLFQPIVCRMLVRRSLRARREPLVPLSPDAVFIRVEDTRTFHKMKLAPDDVGVLRATENGVDLELGRQRIHLAPGDLRAEVQQVPGGTGLTLSSQFGEWPFSITLAPMLKTGLWEGFTSMRPRLEQLQREIVRATAPKPPPLPPGVAKSF